MTCAGTSKGNATVAVLIHDASELALAELDEAVFSAFRHFGIPFRLELLEDVLNNTIIFQEICSSAVLFVPQSGTMGRLSSTGMQMLRSAVHNGLGLVCYEQDVTLLPGWIQGLFSLSSLPQASEKFTKLVTMSTNHFITWTRTAAEQVSSDQPLVYGIQTLATPNTVLANEHGRSLLECDVFGEGKVVLFPFSIQLFTMDYVGHACGADDIFTRSIIWAARKPFATWSMPPKAGLVIDDCSGSYNHFGYLKVLNHHRWSPYLGLFTDTIDEVAHEDIHKAARKLHEGWVDGTLDIGFHALRYNNSFCFNHLERRPLSDSELSDRFACWDRYENDWGIRHSKWAHPHFGEISSAAIPYYIERGIEFITYLLPLDAAWFDVPSRIPSLPSFPPFGHPGYYMTPLPEYSQVMGCNCVLDHKRRTTSDYVVRTDYLWNHTPFWDESVEPNIQESALTLADQIRRGLDAGFYGEGATHEQRIACLREGELQEIFQEADRLLSRYEFERCTISSILPLIRTRMKTRLLTIDQTGANGMLKYSFLNSEAVGTELQIYTDSEKGIQTTRHEVKTKEGEVV